MIKVVICTPKLVAGEQDFAGHSLKLFFSENRGVKKESELKRSVRIAYPTFVMFEN